MNNKEQIIKAEWSLIFTIIGTGITILAAMISMFLWIRSESSSDRRELFSLMDKMRTELILSNENTKKDLQSAVESTKKDLQSAVDKAIAYNHSQIDQLKNENHTLREKMVACEITVGNIKNDHNQICSIAKPN